jgi:hypothetical protein
MTRDGMPRAYLRVDPNLDQTHPDVNGFIRLLCAAARQPDRGRFRNRRLLEQLLSKSKVFDMLARGDVVVLADERVYVEGWDEWQEGDHTVAERMRRMRDRRSKHRNAPVTAPLPAVVPVTTDAVDTKEGRSPSSAEVTDDSPQPPIASRANGTNPRALEERAAQGRLQAANDKRRAVREIRARYYAGEINEDEERRLLDELDMEPDDLRRKVPAT